MKGRRLFVFMFEETNVSMVSPVRLCYPGVLSSWIQRSTSQWASECVEIWIKECALLTANCDVDLRPQSRRAPGCDAVVQTVICTFISQYSNTKVRHCPSCLVQMTLDDDLRIMALNTLVCVNASYWYNIAKYRLLWVPFFLNFNPDQLGQPRLHCAVHCYHLLVLRWNCDLHV